MQEPLILSSPLTFSDWVLKDNGPTTDPAGIRYVLERCKAFGFKRIYWRCYDAGRSTYNSKLMEPMVHTQMTAENLYNDDCVGSIFASDAEDTMKLQRIDFSQLDSLHHAVKIGHELDLEVHAWASINEDDHGGGWPSRFSVEHPQYHWINRSGRIYRSQLSFAFEAVRQYKLDLIRELLTYDIDGLFIDWMRTGDVRDNPQADDEGVADYGYEEPNIRSFREQYNLDPHCLDNGDPRWLSVRSEPITQFMRQCRDLVKKHHKQIPLAVMGHNPWGYRGVLPGLPGYEKYRNMGGNKINGSYRGMLCNLADWAQEQLIDAAVAAGYYLDGGDSEQAHQSLLDETAGKVNAWLYEWVPRTVSALSEYLRRAEKRNANQILFWEADYIDNIPESDAQAITNFVRELRAEGRIQ